MLAGADNNAEMMWLHQLMWAAYHWPFKPCHQDTHLQLQFSAIRYLMLSLLCDCNWFARTQRFVIHTVLGIRAILMCAMQDGCTDLLLKVDMSLIPAQTLGQPVARLTSALCAPYLSSYKEDLPWDELVVSTMSICCLHPMWTGDGHQQTLHDSAGYKVVR